MKGYLPDNRAKTRTRVIEVVVLNQNQPSHPPRSGHLLRRQEEADNRSVTMRVWNALWMLVFLAAIGLLSVRIAGAFHFGSNDLELALLISLLPLLTYALFLLEGVQVAAIQLKSDPLDQDDFERYRDQHKLSPHAIEKLKTQQRDLVGHFFKFIIGRQLCVIATVVGQAIIINRIQWNIPADAPVRAELAQWGSFINGDLTTFVVATIIPYWIAQLLSQFLADERPLTFLRLPACFAAVKLTLIVSTLGVGRPAMVLERLTSRTTNFRYIERSKPQGREGSV